MLSTIVCGKVLHYLDFSNALLESQSSLTHFLWKERESAGGKWLRITVSENKISQSSLKQTLPVELPTPGVQTGLQVSRGSSHVPTPRCETEWSVCGLSAVIGWDRTSWITKVT